MTDLEQLQQRLAARGFTLSDERATDMATRLAGSVPAYLAKLKANDDAAEQYQPLAGEPSAKFSEPVAYDVESPAQSGLPD